jgi:hypothetical protein
MSRSFNGGFAPDHIEFAPGNVPAAQGPITVAVLAKASALTGFTGWMIQATESGSAVWGALTSNSGGPKLFIENDFTAGVEGLTTSWAWYVVEKDAGVATPVWHIGVFVDETTISWTHTPGAGTVNPLSAGPPDSVTVSQNNTSGAWRGSEAVTATWDSRPFADDAAVEATFTHAAADVLAAGPGWMVRLNQTSVSDTVTDDTGGGGDQVGISGTAIDPDDPPGFDYSLAPPAPAEGLAAFTLGLGIDVDGARDSGGLAALSLGLAPTAQGARGSAGAAALVLGLGLDVDGARDSAGSAALALDLALGATGEAPPVVPPAEGSVTFHLNLALAARGAAQAPGCLPFPWACSDLPAFTETCVPVPSFSEVAP